MKWRHLARADLGLALGLLAVGLVEIFVLGSQDGLKLLTVPAVISLTLPLAWRRRAPLVVLGIPFLMLVAQAVAARLADLEEWPRPTSVAMLVGWILAVYSTGAHAALPRSVIGVLIGLSFTPVAIAADPARSASDMDPINFLFILIPWLTGVALRRHRVQAEALRELAERLAREQEQHAEAAVVAERTRIARELHDEIAHSISVIAVQADAAEGALVRDATLVEEPLAAIKTTARSALTQMRQLLGVLRARDEPPSRSPRPGLAQLEALVDQARRAGMSVELHIQGQPAPLSPAIDASAYRIIQEGLTNVRKHAGRAPARVVVSYGPRQLTLEIRDHGRGADRTPGRGYGLIGVRERVELYGGEMSAGPAPGGGYLLAARLPVHAETP